MNDREIYCDRDPYDRSSDIILLDIDEKTITNDIELQYVKKYKSYCYQYRGLCMDIKYRSEALNKTLKQSEYVKKRLGKEFSNSNALENEKKEITEKINIKNQLYNELVNLENSTPIQTVLMRERKPDEVITLEFSNRELPNIPYNVLSHNSNTYLPNDEKTKSHNNGDTLSSENEINQDIERIIAEMQPNGIPNKELQDILNKYYKKFLKVFENSEIVSPNFYKELLPFMLAISNISVSINYDLGDVNLLVETFTDWVENLGHKNDMLNQIDERQKLYTDAMMEKINPRYEWCMFNAPKDDTNPIIRCLGVFGDIITNPDCANDYKNAPICIHDIFQVVEFAQIMTTKFTALIMDFHKDITKFYNNFHKKQGKKKHKKKSSKLSLLPFILSVSFLCIIFIYIILIILFE